ncbi:MAG: hypothetical protein M1482_04155 [Chloroflexi bacterium]|nr:hypothetical protein [Chloroflexota bacterium]
MATGQVVDTPSAQEFMREAMQKITLEELDAIEQEVADKSARFQDALGPDRISRLTPDDFRGLFRTVFAVRRKVERILAAHGESDLRDQVDDLIYGGGELAERFQAFCDIFSELDENARCDLASELLHYARPEEYWLWTRWMWDPAAETGSLPLVTMDDFDLHAPSLGETYLKVGQAMAFVNATGEAAGFTRIGQRTFGADVFLACVYGVYTYTVLRLRMTNEFNKVMPKLPELARRLLGVWDKKAYGIRKAKITGGNHAD